MLTLYHNNNKQISTDEAQKIIELLEIKNPGDIAKFEAEAPGHHTMWELWYHVFDQGISTDWKWEADDLIDQASRLFPDRSIKFIEYTEKLEYSTVRFEVGGIEHVCELHRENPTDLIVCIENIIGHGQFIHIDFNGDDYNWLYTTAKLDNSKLNELCRITGLEPVCGWVHNKLQVDSDCRPLEKIFFTPCIRFANLGGNMRPITSDWSGRILPGQTLREGIATELKNMIDYTGRFDFYDFIYEDTSKDTKGKDIKKYSVDVVLYSDEKEDLKITLFGNPVLRKMARQLTKDEIMSDNIQNLISNIKHTLKEREYGVGLAAPQVSASVALSVIGIKPTPLRPNLEPFETVLINPEIIESFGDPIPMWEGCISSGLDKNTLFGQVPRFEKIRLRWFDEKAEEHNEELEGFVAHAVQHEVDHLNGVLFVDKVEDTKSYMLADEYRKRIVVANEP